LPVITFGLFTHMACGATYTLVPFIDRKSLGGVAGIIGAGGVAKQLCTLPTLAQAAERSTVSARAKRAASPLSPPWLNMSRARASSQRLWSHPSPPK
jgi:hypothetical protein